MINLEVFIRDLEWDANYSGEDVGYEKHEVVELYLLRGTEYGFYIDINTMELLKVLSFRDT